GGPMAALFRFMGTTAAGDRRDAIPAGAASAALDPGDPLVHAALEQVHRQRPAAKHRVVEPADVEALAQFRLGLAPELLDPEHADLVRRGLSRPGDVALHFRAHRGV